VSHDGIAVALTQLEWKLLRTLAANAERTLTHRFLFEAVWERVFGNPQQYLRVHLPNLRRKVEPDRRSPRLIVTEPNVGYRFSLPEGEELGR
jgi:two-component system KDP operon response regulator KdpE